jgi:thiosulfate reductase cytochrome b subunit
MADSAWVAPAISALPASARAARHSGMVRLTHWLTTIAFLALLVTGGEILLSHPRFYWGETGNINMQPLFKIPVPSSRDMVPTGYGYVLKDQNGWSRSLHFQSAWLLVITGLVYAAAGLATGHFRRGLLPGKAECSPRALGSVIAHHLRFGRPEPREAWSYNPLQKISYLAVILVLFPLVIWTGLAMSPAFDAIFPPTVTLLGGQQSARSIHFFVSIALLLFLLIHVAMVIRAGFWTRMRAMITGRVSVEEEQA